MVKLNKKISSTRSYWSFLWMGCLMMMISQTVIATDQQKIPTIYDPGEIGLTEHPDHQTPSYEEREFDHL